MAYTPFKDLNNGDFLLVKPHGHFLVPMWMGITQCGVVKDEQNENFKMVKVPLVGSNEESFKFG
jgi:hypothetical protein